VTALRQYLTDLLRVGSFAGRDGRGMDVDVADLVAIEQEMNRAVANGVRVPVVFCTPDHPEELNESTPDIAKDPRYAGDVQGWYVQGDWLRSVIESGSKELPRNIGASVWIEPQHVVDGETYAPFVRHVGLLTDPAVTGQRGMVQLRRATSGEQQQPEATEGVIVLRKEHAMSLFKNKSGAQLAGKTPPPAADAGSGVTEEDLLKRLKESLKLAPEATLLDVLLAVAAAGIGSPELEAEAQQLNSVAGVPSTTMAMMRQETEPAETEAEKAIKLRVAASEDRLRDMDRQAYERELDLLAAPTEGRITPAVRDRAKSLFASAHGIRLRAGDKGAELRGDDVILSLLRELPKHHVADDNTVKLRAVHGLPATSESLTVEQVKAEQDKTRNAHPALRPAAAAN
jgi:hypothetical protein